MKTAMRNKDQTALSVIRMANAAVKQFEIDRQTEAQDTDITSIISKMIKQRKDSAKIYSDAGRNDLADKENAEIEVLLRYLPKMLGTEEIRAAVNEAVNETSAKGTADMGKVMGILKNRLAGKADMGEVNRVLKEVLSQI